MRTLKGTIVSHKMQKTAVVRVDALKKHPRYGKYYRASRRFKAHDEKDEYRLGDVVRMEETRPLSKEKRWRIVSLIKRAEEDASEETSAEEIQEKV